LRSVDEVLPLVLHEEGPGLQVVLVVEHEPGVVEVGAGLNGKHLLLALAPPDALRNLIEVNHGHVGAIVDTSRIAAKGFNGVLPDVVGEALVESLSDLFEALNEGGDSLFVPLLDFLDVLLSLIHALLKVSHVGSSLSHDVEAAVAAGHAFSVHHEVRVRRVAIEGTGLVAA